jgi:2-hydroxychromene-2-carboxylate isomerase
VNLPTATWYFDFVSPFSYLQWQRLDRLRAKVAFAHRPIVFAAVLNAIGQKGPAEIPGKRQFTYQHVHWRAATAGIPFRFPPAHPFNPLAALRLCIAAGSSARAISAIFDHLWGQGLAGDSAEALAPVAEQLGIADVAQAIAAPAVKATLRENTDAALRDGVFGVPTVALNGRLFWGDDATPMLEAYLEDPRLFESAEMARLAQLPIAASRA